MTHTFHDPIDTHGLADGCPRCDEQARAPFESLDRDTLAALFARGRRRDVARSVNERRAMDAISDVLWRAEVLASLSGKAAPGAAAGEQAAASLAVVAFPEPLASRKAPRS